MFQNTMIFRVSEANCVTGDRVWRFSFFKTLSLVGNLKEIHHSEYLSTDIIILKWILENRMERHGVNCSGLG